MARGSGLAPYRDLARSMKGRPFPEIQAAMRDLKRELGSGERRERNPSLLGGLGSDKLLMYGAIAAGAYFLYNRYKQQAATVPAVATPASQGSGF